MPKKIPEKVTSSLTSRPPVVVIMGHIDHGKSTLLDYIRKTKVVSGEAGGITQHLGAYEVAHSKGKITFLDTPGHEAFTSIRERGAKVADIAILVVSAEDGVKPQTLEALRSIKSENLPYIVAINKIDKPAANVEVTKQNLAEHEVYVEGYGGDVPVVPISALKGTGISDLLDMIILVSELADLKADVSASAEGVIIESYRDSKKGISATLLIKNGTIKLGSYIVAEDAISPVRILENYEGENIETATFSSPVKIIGFNKIPKVGAQFAIYENKKEAETVAAEYESKKISIQNVPVRRTENDTTVVIPVILKADVIGSLDGIKHELAKIKNDKVKIKIVSESIGDVNENDIKSTQGDPNIIILAFNSKPDSKTQTLIERATIPTQIKTFDIIYNLINYIKDMVISKVPKEYVDQASGTAKILAIFSKNKDKQILGGKVQEGSISVGSEVKILRRDAEIGRGKIKELQQTKKRTDKVEEGFEFGCLIESKTEIALGDKVQGFVTVEKTS